MMTIRHTVAQGALWFGSVLGASSMASAGAALGASNQPAAAPPVCKVFILAGQSNMEGQGVVDLMNKDHNDGRGSLTALAADPSTAGLVDGLRNADGSWRTRDDVFVRYTPEGRPAKVGPLAFGFTPYLDAHHFGPEIGFGQVMGDAMTEPVLLIKTAWGGKSLFTDFRPPSSGGTVGPYYTRMIDDVRTALAKVPSEVPALAGHDLQLAGFVWYHGWNDGCDPANAVPAYEQNLVNLVGDVRREFNAPELPVVIGEITGPWVEAPAEWGTLRRAQAAGAARAEVRGAGPTPRACFVPTAAFVRDPQQSPCPGHGHHEFANAETYLLVGRALGEGARSLTVPGAPAFVPTLPAKADAPAATAAPTIKGEMSGYMLVPLERVPAQFNAGFSMYAAAWPLVERYPGSNFQTGLFGTWMFAQYERGPNGKPDPNDKPGTMYSDIEGGLGWWRDTRFATTVPKFIMGGVAPDFIAWANGPGAGKGRDWSKPLGKDAIAQLSPWVVWPPDGLNLAQGTCGELFGYGYIPLPLVPAVTATADRPMAMGDQCWTLFVNSTNFKGPIAFFTPRFWAEHAVKRPELVGKLLDTRSSDPNKAFQMETQWVPAQVSAPAKDGATYARVAPTSFPVDDQGRTVVLHRLTCYTRAALPDAVRAWFAGGPPASGALDPAASHVQQFKDGGGSTWRIFGEGTKDDERRDIDWSAFGTPTAHDAMTYGYRWNPALVKRVERGAAGPGARMHLPQHFRLTPREGHAPHWTAIEAKAVPAETGLAAVRFATPRERGEGAYTTPTEPDSPFRSPGPVAGPFETTLGDGSTVTYSWYLFKDQPAMLAAGLTDAERDEAQRRAELLHRAWTKEREYIAPPTTGSLASIDPALLVTPPAGFEIGYVPIATRQERKPAR